MIDVRDHGAKGDGQTDDTAAITAALKAGGKNHSVYMPGGVYVVTQPIAVTAKRLVGEHHWREFEGGTVIRYEGPPTPEGVIWSHSNAFQIESLIIDANHKAAHGIKATKCHGVACSAVNVTTAYAVDSGFVADECSGAVFDRIVSSRCDGAGFVLLGCNGAVLSNMQAAYCKGAGVEVVGAFAEQTRSSAGLQVRGGIMQNNQGPGVWLRGIGGRVEVGNLYIERDEQHTPAPDGVRITDSISVLVGRINVSGGRKDNAAAYRLEGNTRNCTIDIASASEGPPTDNSPPFARIQHDADLANGNKFRDCTRNSARVSQPLPVYDASGNEVQQ